MTVNEPIKLYADLRRFARVETGELPWQPSPAPGIERRLIERDGAEAARATSLVRYASGSQFPAHAHPLGEEILVLEGTFGDELGQYPAGSYLRNPPGSSHAPWTRDGCVIFVKLRHMDPADHERVVLDTRTAPWQPGAVPGLALMRLGGCAGEVTQLLRAGAGTGGGISHDGGAEVLVLEGAFADEHGLHPRGTWLRYPPGSRHTPRSAHGCMLWLKRGHLPPPH